MMMIMIMMQTSRYEIKQAIKTPKIAQITATNTPNPTPNQPTNQKYVNPYFPNTPHTNIIYVWIVLKVNKIIKINICVEHVSNVVNIKIIILYVHMRRKYVIVHIIINVHILTNKIIIIKYFVLIKLVLCIRDNISVRSVIRIVVCVCLVYSPVRIRIWSL